ncbi:unnamed protein product [Cylicocyclus nassatus]|uniref:Peptidase S1 domain-containing protein n=1 Tax=Cylicocyclus nassatus TaxID=53992 RepID=A0AA36MH56_CYLNA|nr:unnamed protein product [Cylicocyclus nassatus]
MWLSICILCLLHLATCMRDVEEIEWNRSAYLVKTLAEAQDGDRVLGCTGTLITPSLVLTSSKCVDNTENNAVVIYAKGSRYRKRAVASITINGDFALLEFHPIKDELCPRSPAPVRLSRLPLNITLTAAPWEKVNLVDLPEAKCRMTGFETVSVSNFSFIHNVMQTPAQVVRDGDRLIVDVASGSPVCWDDIGLPLECLLPNKGWTQVGLLHSVIRNVDNRTNSTLTDCDDIRVLVFATFSDDTLPTMLENHAVQMFVTTKRCFTQAPVETTERELIDEEAQTSDE